MNRRSLLKRVAAIAAAVAVAPAVKAEAAPEDALRSGQPFDPDAFMASLTPEMRAEVLRKVAEYRGSLGLPMSGEYDLTVTNQGKGTYLRILHEDGTVKAEYLTPTFEAMAADCAARGCRLETYKYSPTSTLSTVEHHSEQDGAVMMARGLLSSFAPDHLTRVDSWRRSLHKPTPAFTFQSDATAGQASSRLVSMEAGQMAQRVYRPRALEAQHRLAESSARAHAVVGTYLRAPGYAAPAGDVLSGGEHRVGLYVDPDLWNAVWVTNADGTRSRVLLT